MPATLGLAVALATGTFLGGCGTVTDSEGTSYPSFHSERVKMASIVDGIKNTMPPEVIMSVRENEGTLSCGTGDILQSAGDGAQILAYRYVIITPDFDALAWMEEIAVGYEQKPGWKVVREASGVTPGSYTDTFWSPENHDTTIIVTPGRLNAEGVFNARDDAVGDQAQKITLASASSCAEKPDNWDAWDDFLRETPLPTPAPDSTPST